MGDLSKNFSRSEFACNCGCSKDPTIDSELIHVLQDCVDYFKKTLKLDRIVAIVLSGYRCRDWNAYIWGQRNAARKIKKLEIEKPIFNSTHATGKAADFTIRGIGADKVYAYLYKQYPNTYGIGKYPDRTHIDVRPIKARWTSNT